MHDQTIAFVFPGQGAQRPAMGEAWTRHPSWELVREAGDLTGRDVARLLLDADAEELRATRNAQLATLVLDVVCLDAVSRIGLEPVAVAGHSLGEYAALVAAGALSFADAVRIVVERGEAMQDAAEQNEGTMAAVLGLEDDEVAVACARVAGDVWVANLNAPGQVVIGGTREAVDAAATVARELGARKVLAIPVSGAFHTPLMAPARERLHKAVRDADLRPAQVPVVANVDAAAHREPDLWATLLCAQLCSPVRWRSSLHALAELGATAIVELGPGTVLSGTVKRTLRGARASSVCSPADVEALVESITADTPSAPAPLDGELFDPVERLVVSPAAGVFVPRGDVAPGQRIEPGTVVGRVGQVEITCAFSGTVAGMLALDGERLAASQPVAWLRT